jgi:DNA-binding CsgD family transcriptional regulator
LIDGPLQRLRAADRPQWRIWGENAAAEIELLSGNEAACIRHADALETFVIDDYWLYGISHAAICAIVAARRLNDQTALRRWIELALSEPKRPKAHHNLARRAMAHAETAAELGDLDVAVTKLAECATHLAEGILAPAGFLPVTFVRLRRAELLLQRNAAGDREEAARELAADVPYLRRARATWYLGRLRDWAHAHDVPFPAEERTPVATGSTSQLTAREHQVAVLVARGFTNRAIADKLVISERTAEGHVEQVRNKLGFHSRSQIAAWVAETMPRSASPR